LRGSSDAWAAFESTSPELLLGSYATALWEILERIASVSYTTVIDIGAGILPSLAPRFPMVQSMDFEARAENRQVLQGGATANGLSDRLRLGVCSIGHLHRRRRIDTDRLRRRVRRSAPARLLIDRELRVADMLIESHAEFCRNCSVNSDPSSLLLRRVERIQAPPAVGRVAALMSKTAWSCSMGRAPEFSNGRS
jgi:hypothetical protein